MIEVGFSSEPMRYFECRCGNFLFFDNSMCLKCGSEVGYDVVSDRMIALDPGAPARRCQNGLDYAVCNWVIAGGSADRYCQSCQLNRTIPDLSFPANLY